MGYEFYLLEIIENLKNKKGLFLKINEYIDVISIYLEYFVFAVEMVNF